MNKELVRNYKLSFVEIDCLSHLYNLETLCGQFKDREGFQVIQAQGLGWSVHVIKSLRDKELIETMYIYEQDSNGFETQEYQARLTIEGRRVVE